MQAFHEFQGAFAVWNRVARTISRTLSLSITRISSLRHVMFKCWACSPARAALQCRRGVAALNPSLRGCFRRVSPHTPPFFFVLLCPSVREETHIFFLHPAEKFQLKRIITIQLDHIFSNLRSGTCNAKKRDTRNRRYLRNTFVKSDGKSHVHTF